MERGCDLTLPDPTVGEIIEVLDAEIRWGQPALVLFDKEQDERHAALLSELTRTDRPNVHVLLWRGEEIATQKAFWAECGRVIPGGSNGCFGAGGGNPNSLRDHLQEDAIRLSRVGDAWVQDPNRRVRWVWSNAHTLFRADPEAFKILFASMAEDAKELTLSNQLGGIGEMKFRVQPTRFVLTGYWPAFEREVGNPESFLYCTRWSQYRPAPPPEPTNLVIIRVTKSHVGARTAP